MNWLDIVLLVVLAWSVVASFRKGLTREIIGLVSVVLGLILGVWFYGAAGSFVAPYVSSRPVSNLIGFFAIFLGVILIGSLIGFILGKFLKVTGLSIVDHALGALFGLARGLLVAVVIVMAVMAFSTGDAPPSAVVRSRMAPYVLDASRILSSMAPYELKEGFRKRYQQVKAAWGKAVERGLENAPGAQRDKNGKNEREI